MDQHTVRPIEARDNAAVEAVIRGCLLEYGMDRPGTAWEDPELPCFFEHYHGRDDAAYWVAQDADGTVVAGVGIGPLAGEKHICELQKMYCLPEARGSGVAALLLEEALRFARPRYRTCYLETATAMKRAQRFYAKHGFQPLAAPLGRTGHYGCDVPMALDLQ